MGGYGTLTLAFAAPERFVAVAAISPAIFPGETPQDVPPRNIPSILGELHHAMSGGRRSCQVRREQCVRSRACTSHQDP
jgi:S-formylglutathione hydrolase